MFRFSFKIILQNVYEEGVKSEIHWVFLCKNHRFAVSDSPKSTSFVAEENASTGGQLALSWTGVMGGS